MYKRQGQVWGNPMYDWDAMKEDEEATVQLTGEIVTRADVHIDGIDVYKRQV